MSEAPTKPDLGAGDPAPAVGAVFPPCGSCGHVHRFTDVEPVAIHGHPRQVVTFDGHAPSAAAPPTIPPTTAASSTPPTSAPTSHVVPSSTTSTPSSPMTTVPSPPTAPTSPAPSPTDSTSTSTPDWACIRLHESGDRYNDPSAPSGAYGIEFTAAVPTWQSLGLSGQPWQSPPAIQDQAALELYHRYGWSPWSSRFACGLG